MVKYLTEFEKVRIIELRNQNLSIREISHKIRRPKSTIGDVLKKWRETKSISPKKKSGRPYSLTPRDIRRAKLLALRNRRLSAKKLIHELGLKTTPKTLKNHLRKEKLNPRRACRKLFLSANYK